MTQQFCAFFRLLLILSVSLCTQVITLNSFYCSFMIQGNGFAAWGPKFTAAGECARISLEFALAAVVISSVLIVIVPTHGIVLFPCTGEIILLNLLWCTRTEFDIRIFWKLSQTTKSIAFLEIWNLRFSSMLMFFSI